MCSNKDTNPDTSAKSAAPMHPYITNRGHEYINARSRHAKWRAVHQLQRWLNVWPQLVGADQRYGVSQVSWDCLQIEIRDELEEVDLIWFNQIRYVTSYTSYKLQVTSYELIETTSRKSEAYLSHLDMSWSKCSGSISLAPWHHPTNDCRLWTPQALPCDTYL